MESRGGPAFVCLLIAGDAVCLGVVNREFEVGSEFGVSGGLVCLHRDVWGQSRVQRLS